MILSNHGKVEIMRLNLFLLIFVSVLIGCNSDNSSPRRNSINCTVNLNANLNSIFPNRASCLVELNIASLGDYVTAWDETGDYYVIINATHNSMTIGTNSNISTLIFYSGSVLTNMARTTWNFTGTIPGRTTDASSSIILD